jgi:hypothetical protein
MGWISMSERDLRRIEVLSEVRAGRRTVAAAAAVLAVSERQAYRLLAKYGYFCPTPRKGKIGDRRSMRGVA